MKVPHLSHTKLTFEDIFVLNTCAPVQKCAYDNTQTFSVLIESTGDIFFVCVVLLSIGVATLTRRLMTLVLDELFVCPGVKVLRICVLKLNVDT